MYTFILTFRYPLPQTLILSSGKSLLQTSGLPVRMQTPRMRRNSKRTTDKKHHTSSKCCVECDGYRVGGRRAGGGFSPEAPAVRWAEPLGSAESLCSILNCLFFNTMVGNFKSLNPNQSAGHILSFAVEDSPPDTFTRLGTQKDDFTEDAKGSRRCWLGDGASDLPAAPRKMLWPPLHGTVR